MDASTHTATAEPAFHADDAEEVAGYHTLSGLAVVGLIFGLASPLCLAWPLLMGIPILGAVLSVVAVRRIEASDGALVGRWAAMVGLVLCVVSGTAAISRDRVTQMIRTGQADEFAHEWIGLLLGGEADKAFRLTVDGNRPERPPEPGMPPPAHSPKELFLQDPTVTRLAAAGAASEVHAVETVAYEPQPQGQFMVQKVFHVEPQRSADTADAGAFDVLLTLQRSQLRGETQPRWLVSGYAVSGHGDEHPHVH
jgi:hypothetical protein